MPPGLPRYDYFEHSGQTGVIGRGATLQDAFVHAAEATFALMCDPITVTQDERIDVEFEEPGHDAALVTWLNLLLAHATERGLALGCFELARDGNHWRGSAWGEPWRADMERGMALKAVSLEALDVKPQSDGWEVRCVVVC